MACDGWTTVFIDFDDTLVDTFGLLIKPLEKEAAEAICQAGALSGRQLLRSTSIYDNAIISVHFKQVHRSSAPPDIQDSTSRFPTGAVGPSLIE
jgi:hypothetical protein